MPRRTICVGHAFNQDIPSVSVHDKKNATKMDVTNLIKSHHPSVHIDKEAHEDSHHLLTSVNNLSGSKSCILPIMKVNGGKNLQQNINIMWDSGSTISMITFKKAKEMQLTGVKAQLSIVKVGGKKDDIESKYYEVPIRDIHGQLVKFNAYGISKISSAINQIDTHLIQEAMPGECLDQLQPTGDVDMLIGFDYAGFHPEKEKAAGHLILLKNRFGRCISGSYKGADGSTTKIVQTAQVSHVCQVPRLVDFYECESLGIHSQPIQPNVVAHLSGEAKIEDFYSNESLGVSCQPQCGSCRCGECPIGGKQYTIKEEQELLLIDKNLKLTNGVWTVTYPWIKPPEELPDNYPLAFAMLKSTEAKLRKNLQLAKTYDEQIRDMVSRGAAKKLSTDELQSYVGPKFYIGHHEILKPESLSTPCRIVFNSSAKFGSHILNDYWAKGPDMMNNLLGVLIRFREDNVAIAGDLKKMYHSVKLSPIDQQTHRFLWRDMQLDRKPDIYVMTAVSFGDKPAGAIATLALRKTAENNAEKFPNAAKIIIKNSYVDDIIDSLSSHEEAKRATNEIEIALNTGGFEIKNWTISNSDAGTVDISHGTEGQSEDIKVLGIVWRPTTDVLQFKASINFSEKVRKIHLQPNLSASDVPDKVPNELTKRMILSQVNRIYDPLGLAAPFTVKAKILLRKLCQYKLNWDDPIPMNERAEWVTFFRELFEMNFVEFVRATKPINATGEPVLIIFCDASKEAFGACAYIRWRTTDGKFVSTLLVAKSRLSPLRELTIVRLELNSGLLGARLKKFITIESRLTFQKIYMITDSEIVRAMIMKESYGFKTFVSLRVGEIQQLTQRGDWYWIEVSLNIADIITRGKEPSSLRIHSDWQNGHSFLKDEETLWPLRQSFSGTIIPEQIIMAIKVTESSVCMSNIIEACRFSYSKLLRITARIVSAFKQNPKPSLKNIKCLPIPEEIREAERMWIKDAQEQITETVKPHTLERLGAANKDGVMVVGTKLESWGPLGNDYPALLPGNCILAKLYVLEEHNRCHLGISAEAAKIQAKYWIIGLRRLLRSIRYNCVTCRKTDKKVQEQLMGQIPLDRLTPAPAWHYTSLAIFGPFEVKGEVNKRSRGKAYGVIFNCLRSRAVHIELASDYSTNAFIMVLRRFIAIRGCPHKIRSDRGAQLIGAERELKDVMHGHNKQTLVEFGADNMFHWEFTTPDAPWQNRCAEALIKSVKRVLKIIIGSQVLSFSELLTVLTECANLVNERPIGKHPNLSMEQGRYLSPNDLLLGRSSSRVPSGPFHDSENQAQRYRFVQRLIDAFWRKWIQDFFPTLIVRQKWHNKVRNVKINDVVMVQDSNMIRGQWKIGRITKSEPSLRDGFVRSVDVRCRNSTNTAWTILTRPVQKIIVLVPVEEQ